MLERNPGSEGALQPVAQGLVVDGDPVDVGRRFRIPRIQVLPDITILHTSFS
jgi:hypothetical protein